MNRAPSGSIIFCLIRTDGDWRKLFVFTCLLQDRMTTLLYILFSVDRFQSTLVFIKISSDCPFVMLFSKISVITIIFAKSSSLWSSSPRSVPPASSGRFAKSQTGDWRAVTRYPSASPEYFNTHQTNSSICNHHHPESQSCVRGYSTGCFLSLGLPLKS